MVLFEPRSFSPFSAPTALQLTPYRQRYFLTSPISIPSAPFGRQERGRHSLRAADGGFRREWEEGECTRPIMRSDIALLRRPLISRHLQFSRPAIHPYFALRHASSNERLWSLALPPSPVPLPATRLSPRHGSVVITRHDGLFCCCCCEPSPPLPSTTSSYSHPFFPR